MTDFRELCARMADELDHCCQVLMDDRRATHALATEARAALAQPEPVAPTDEEIMEVFWEHQNGLEELWADDWPAAARAVLARWGK
jgi:hypothetical protein